VPYLHLDLRRTFHHSKVPEVDGAFWFLKLLTTAMGEATSDYLVHRFNPELAVVSAAVVFFVVIWWQLRSPRYLTTIYWGAVVMVSIFGTMCADVLHVAFGVPYAVSASGYALVLAAVFISWWRVEHTLSIHSILSTRRELFYWATITTTFALGTAVGDLSATTLGLGYLRSFVLFALIFCLPALGYRLLSLNAVAMFWTAYVLARPVGASFSDYLSFPTQNGGRDWGPGKVAVVFFAIFVVGLLYVLARDKSRRRATRRVERGTSRLSD
jgi:uncharacterized membrane-anchored protein